MSEITEVINEIIINKLDIKEQRISEDAQLFEDLGVDSIDIVELVISLEVKFGIEIPDEDIVKLKYLKDLYKYIDSRVKEMEN